MEMTQKEINENFRIVFNILERVLRTNIIGNETPSPYSPTGAREGYQEFMAAKKKLESTPDF